MPLPLKSQEKSHLRSEGQIPGAQAPRPPPPPGPTLRLLTVPTTPTGAPSELHTEASEDTREWTPRLELAVAYGPDCPALQEGRASRGGRSPLQ